MTNKETDTNTELDNHTKAWINLMDTVMATPQTTVNPPLPYREVPNVGATRLRKPRRRKEVTAEKFIVLRVTKELHDQVQSASDGAGVGVSEWVRLAVQGQLNK